MGDTAKNMESVLLHAIAKQLAVNRDAKNSDESKKTLQEVTFKVADNSDLLFTISCLLKVCVVALEGDVSFLSPTLANSEPKAAVSVVLELAINLLPYEGIHNLDRVCEMLEPFDSAQGKSC